MKNIFWIFFFFLSGCAHINDKIHGLPIRANKAQILKALGQPMNIRRLQGKDHWIYKFTIDGRHYTRAVIIKDNMLHSKGKLRPYSLKKF